MSAHEKIAIVGSDGKEHLVDAGLIDMFYSGRTGELITDEEWDEQMRRLREAEAADDNG